MAKLVEQISEYFDIDEKYIEVRLKNHNKFYRKAFIPKKRGGVREIYLPSVELKAIQYFILEKYLLRIDASEYAMAYKKGCSILDNANSHINNKHFFIVDLADFFNSLDFNAAQGILIKFFEKDLGIDGVKEMLAFMSFENHFVQGCITSPHLSNIIFKEIDYEIVEKFRYLPNFKYTRYSDDIVISSSEKIDKKIYTDLSNILSKHKFKINRKKTYFTSSKNFVRITGINLYQQKELKVGTKYKKELKNMIYYKIKYGVHAKESCEKIIGKLMFLKCVEPLYYDFLNIKYRNSEGCLLIDILRKMNKQEIEQNAYIKGYEYL